MVELNEKRASLDISDWDFSMLESASEKNERHWYLKIDDEVIMGPFSESSTSKFLKSNPQIDWSLLGSNFNDGPWAPLLSFKVFQAHDKVLDKASLGGSSKRESRRYFLPNPLPDDKVDIVANGKNCGHMLFKDFQSALEEGRFTMDTLLSIDRGKTWIPAFQYISHRQPQSEEGLPFAPKSDLFGDQEIHPNHLPQSMGPVLKITQKLEQKRPAQSEIEDEETSDGPLPTEELIAISKPPIFSLKNIAVLAAVCLVVIFGVVHWQNGYGTKRQYNRQFSKNQKVRANQKAQVNQNSGPKFKKRSRNSGGNSLARRSRPRTIRKMSPKINLKTVNPKDLPNAPENNPPDDIEEEDLAENDSSEDELFPAGEPEESREVASELEEVLEEELSAEENAVLEEEMQFEDGNSDLDDTAPEY